MTFWTWSRTASSNSNADSTINWAEGQAPSSVNDSARAVMAAAAKYRDDVSGATATGGSSSAYTLSSYQVFDTLAHMSGAMVAFTPHTTSAAAPTLNVDGLGAKAIRSAPSIELPDGALIAGTPYVATYYNATSEWILQGGAVNPYSIPLGSGIDYWGATAPNSAFALAYGQAISRTTYATLFSLFGTTYGNGDGSTTFNIPDTRGRVVAGKDNMGGSSASRLTSTYFGTAATALGAVGGSESHTLTAGQLPADIPYTLTGQTQAQPTVFIGLSHGLRGGSSLDDPTNYAALPAIPVDISGDINPSGGGAHNNVPPTIISNYIIRVI